MAYVLFSPPGSPGSVGPSLAEQIKLIGPGGLLVGPHGAGMSHCTLAAAGSVVIEIQGKVWDLFEPYCAAAGVTHLMYTTATTGEAPVEIVWDDFVARALTPALARLRTHLQFAG